MSLFTVHNTEAHVNRICTSFFLLALQSIRDFCVKLSCTLRKTRGNLKECMHRSGNGERDSRASKRQVKQRRVFIEQNRRQMQKFSNRSLPSRYFPRRIRRFNDTTARGVGSRWTKVEEIGGKSSEKEARGREGGGNSVFEVNGGNEPAASNSCSSSSTPGRSSRL